MLYFLGDVYQHGNSAKPDSAATVKEYERRRKELQKMKYKYDQCNRFMKLFRKKKNNAAGYGKNPERSCHTAEKRVTQNLYQQIEGVSALNRIM